MRNLRMAERIAATPVRDPFRFVIAGDTGAWPDPTADARPDRGALFHAVEITLAESGAVRGRVIQAFAPPWSAPPFTFGD
jgi:hypothetical protein